MARIVVLGGGVAGLSSAMLLAADGHEVTVLERDGAPAPPGEEAWRTWDRRGVNQFRLPHLFLSRFRQMAEAELPQVTTALDDSGALRFNIVDQVPTEMTGGRRDGDEDLEILTGRRPMVEAAMASVAQDAPGVCVRRGVAVAALLANPDATSVPHVTGVRTADGEHLSADLIVDAMGRRSSLPSLLAKLGARPPQEELEDCGFVYYGRHFRSSDGTVPPIFGPLLMEYGTVSTLTLPADNGSWGVVLVASARDAELRRLRDPDTWTSAMRTFPLVAHWIDGEPIDDGVSVMAKIEDRHRCFVVNDIPVVTGVLAVGDAWACTNPSLGRGASMGLLHAVTLRDLLRSAPWDDPIAFARAWHDRTAETVEPWYRATLQLDRHRLAEIEAELAGDLYAPDDPVFEIARALGNAAGKDPDLFRLMLRTVGLLDLPDKGLGEPGVTDRVIALGAGWRDEPLPGPTRQELLQVIGT